MSMTTSPFGTPATEAPLAPVTTVEEVVEPKRRNVIVLAAVAGALAVGAGAYFLLFAGGTDPVVGAAPVTPRTPRVVASAPAKVPAAPPIKKYVAKKSRNPLLPLVSPPVAAVTGGGTGTTSAGPGTTGAGSGTTGAGTTGAGTSTGTTGTGTTSVGSGTTGSGTTSGTVSGTVRGGTTSGSTTGTVPTPTPSASAPTSSKPVDVSVLAVDFAKRTASIKINRNTYDRSIGETFATYFKLIGVTKGTCAYVQYGDVALPMCVGQPLTLQ